MIQIMRFEMNVPTEVALKDACPGIAIEGRYGNRVMYTLTDNRVMYVAPIVASQISDLGIQAGERFHICKQMKRQGTHRRIEWHVRRLSSDSETPMERHLRESLVIAQTTIQSAEPKAESNPSHLSLVEQVHPSDQYLTATGVLEESGTHSKNHGSQTQNGNSSQRAVDIGCDCAPDPPTTSSPEVPTQTVHPSSGSPNRFPTAGPRNGNSAPVPTKLEHALKTAISAANNAEKYGAELGYVVRFDADAIKSMAITVLINMSEGNRR